jgi:hypothetical protein
MSKRTTEESRIVTYFQSSPFPTANAIFGVVRDIVKRRAQEEVQSSEGKNEQAPVIRRKKRAKKVNSAGAAGANSTTMTTMPELAGFSS